MKRGCKRITGTKDGKRAIYIDTENEAEILAYFRQDPRHHGKWVDIARIILEGHHNPDLYKREAINEDCKHVTAMRFFPGQENDRIYCQEVTTAEGTFVVIAAVLLKRKKNDRNKARENAAIERVASYEYDL